MPYSLNNICTPTPHTPRLRTTRVCSARWEVLDHRELANVHQDSTVLQESALHARWGRIAPEKATGILCPALQGSSALWSGKRHAHLARGGIYVPALVELIQRHVLRGWCAAGPCLRLRICGVHRVWSREHGYEMALVFVSRVFIICIVLALPRHSMQTNAFKFRREN